jgi:hypothetical protein
MHPHLKRHKKSRAGTSLLEAMIAVGILAVSGLAMSYISSMVNSGARNSKTQFGAQSLRSSLGSIISNPNVCSQQLNSVTFNPAQAAISSATQGFPLKFTLLDGTIIDGNAPGRVSLYSVNLDGLTFQTNGAAVPIPGLVDQNPGAGCDLNNIVYVGDVTLNVDKGLSVAVDGGTALSSAEVGTLMLTVENDGTNKICDCYSPNPCLANGGSFSAINTPKCSLCPVNTTWVGNNVAGAPICLPQCSVPGQFLVSNGAGGASCKTPDCPSATLSWNVGGFACQGTAALTAKTTTTAPIASTNGNIGSATFTCSATGTWPALPNLGATCAPPVSNCPAGPISWQVAGVSCLGVVGATPPSTASALVASTNTNIGNAVFTCSAAGTWPALPNAGATCQAPIGNCPAAPVSWNVGGAVCSGAAGSTPPSTVSAPITSTDANIGTATFTCSAAGTWSAAPDAGATCVPPSGNCPAGPLSWTVSGLSCSGPALSTPPSTVSAPIAATSANSGSATFTCSAAGTWSAAPNAGATCAGPGTWCPVCHYPNDGGAIVVVCRAGVPTIMSGPDVVGPMPVCGTTPADGTACSNSSSGCALPCAGTTGVTTVYWCAAPSAFLTHAQSCTIQCEGVGF